MSVGLLISVAGLVLAVPGALVSYRDWRRGRTSPEKPASHASEPGTYTSELGARTSRPGADAPVEREWRSRQIFIPRRLLSALIDFYALLLLSSGVAVVVDPSSSSAETEGVSAAFSLTMVLMVAGYVVLMGRTGRSPGKLVVGARLERADTPGTPPGIGRAFVHALVALPLGLFTYLIALGRKDRRAVHDLAAGTRVVRTR